MASSGARCRGIVSMGRPNQAAVRRAAGASLRSGTSTTKHNRSLAPSSAAYDATSALSVPPDKNSPTGTSARRRRATDSPTSCSSRASASASVPVNGGGHEGLQYGATSGAPPGEKASVQPGGNAKTPSYTVSG